MRSELGGHEAADFESGTRGGVRVGNRLPRGPLQERTVTDGGVVACLRRESDESARSVGSLLGLRGRVRPCENSCVYNAPTTPAPQHSLTRGSRSALNPDLGHLDPSQPGARDDQGHRHGSVLPGQHDPPSIPARYPARQRAQHARRQWSRRRDSSEYRDQRAGAPRAVRSAGRAAPGRGDIQWESCKIARRTRVGFEYHGIASRGPPQRWQQPRAHGHGWAGRPREPQHHLAAEPVRHGHLLALRARARESHECAAQPASCGIPDGPQPDRPGAAEAREPGPRGHRTLA